MEAACTDWVKKTVPLSGAEGIQATFNNGSGGVWDNNGGKNYDLGSGNITVKDGVVAHSDRARTAVTGPSPTPAGRGGAHRLGVLLHRHRRLDDHQPPLPAPAAPGPPCPVSAWSRVHRLGEEDGRPRSATSMKAAFNNGNGVWDNNNGSDYTIPAGSAR